MVTKVLGWAAGLSLAMVLGSCSTTEDLGTLDVRAVADPFLGPGTSSYVPTTYRVYDDQGMIVRKDATGEIPLPPGKYLVYPEHAPPDLEAFWVRIEAGKRTEVDLNRPAESR